MKYLPFSVASILLGTALAAAQAPATHTAAAAAPAQTTAAPAQAKVAVIVFRAAVSQTNEFQRDFADLQKKYDPKRQALQTLSAQIDTLTKQLQSSGTTLSDDERASRARTIDEKKKQLDRDSQDAQSDFQGDMQELVNRIAGKVGEVMTDYAGKHGYTLVLDASQSQDSPTVLYAVPSTDITKAVIDAYNEKSGVPAPPPPAPEAPKPQAPPTK
ncbi:MAG TPA: OmpH family outer membrane protein [Terracidiphilus sp.]|nr:OmpH family outer membrane protein [Terracidiphilus sp.]